MVGTLTYRTVAAPNILETRVTLYGPHCPHDECSMLACSEDDQPHQFCNEAGTCPYCGPDSRAFDRLADAQRDWLNETYGTVDPDVLQDRGVHPNIVEDAKFIALG